MKIPKISFFLLKSILHLIFSYFDADDDDNDDDGFLEKHIKSSNKNIVAIVDSLSFDDWKTRHVFFFICFLFSIFYVFFMYFCFVLSSI